MSLEIIARTKALTLSLAPWDITIEDFQVLNLMLPVMMDQWCKTDLWRYTHFRSELHLATEPHTSHLRGLPRLTLRLLIRLVRDF
jgi:hypothetical protein